MFARRVCSLCLSPQKEPAGSLVCGKRVLIGLQPEEGSKRSQKDSDLPPDSESCYGYSRRHWSQLAMCGRKRPVRLQPQPQRPPLGPQRNVAP